MSAVATSPHAEAADRSGDGIMPLEPRPFRPFKTSEEYLYAMKEDLAEWLNMLYVLRMTAENFMEVLETGVVLCEHANSVRLYADQFQSGHLARSGRRFSVGFHVPSWEVNYNRQARAGSFFARDNISNFIRWCKELGVLDCLMFETEDLVSRKNEKHVILCLLEIGRRGAKFGMAAPMLVQFEQQIDREIAEPFYATLVVPPAEEAGLSPDNRQLSFVAQGSLYNLTLQPAPSFVDPDFLVLHRYENFTSIARAGGGRSGSCFYWGELARDPDSDPEADLDRSSDPGSDPKGDLDRSSNLSGDPKGDLDRSSHPDGDPKGDPDRSSDLDRDLGRDTSGESSCDPDCEPDGSEERNEDRSPEAEEDVREDRTGRPRRAVARHQLTIELAVFVDLALQKQMKDLYGEHTDNEITRFVMAMVNAMELLYDDSSLERKIRFVLKRLELLETAPAELEQQRDINAFLTSFCKWQQRHNPAADEDPLHWDHAVLLTGVDLFTAAKTANKREVNRQVVGFAPVGGMCTAASSCTVNEGKDFESVYIVAHEIGHSLGMHHDGQGNACNEEDHIMSPTLGTGKNTWSTCSRDYLDRFAAARQADCLRDWSLGGGFAAQRPSSLPGERIGADEQCRLKYGPSSARAREQPLSEVCVNLHCKYDHHRWTSHPALEGTACGYDTWCRRGQCVARDAAGSAAPSAPADGGWSQWSEFSPCASSCLYGADGSLAAGSAGVRERFRRCNSPYPRNGGTECTGGARQYETCDATALCARAGRRTVTEYAQEICAKAARGDRKLSGRGISRVTSNAFDACNIWCERRDAGFERHRQSFPDGVRCATRHTTGLRPQHCVDGRCQEFACDGDSLFAAGADPVGWAAWRSYSRCRFSCTAPAEGLELVQRRCRRAPCRGLHKTVRHCAPQLDGTDCVSLRTPFEYATDVCQRYREKLSLSQLSGIGMQLAASAEDPDRPCTVTCQDRDASLRFYRVKGREGWFPSGMDCARGREQRTAFCLSGKCVDFGGDGTPLHDSKYDYAFLFESSFRFHRVIRALRNGTVPRRGSVDRAFIESVIAELRLQEGSGAAVPPAQRSRDISADDIDMGNPLLLTELPADFPAPPLAPVGNELGHAFALGEPGRRVRDLVERCSCPSQFPMIRVSEGKYRIGDTKTLIFVRILRNHVMVRVGGGWDTLEHYLDKHDPCRCKAGHRTAIASRLFMKSGPHDGERQLSGVKYERLNDSDADASSPATAAARTPISHRSSPAPKRRSAHTPPGKRLYEEASGDSSSEVSDEGYRSQGPWKLATGLKESEHMGT
ncbi:uncharacterized protein LOC119111074 [Pollicipes pollicipes]|uniref:uncharacterized protein LOC119111074 n=1 Tax=Pollicipes pollicipes TaxID=41117 RepID=UPI00188577C4|nr:uncharacterized protein LOC119111074 [Pollicipes pollicipes]